MGIISRLKASMLGGTAVETEVGESEPGPVVQILLALRRSLTMFTLALGVTMIVAGVVLEFTLANQGVLAAMLVIWGLSALVVGILGYGFIIWIRSR